MDEPIISSDFTIGQKFILFNQLLVNGDPVKLKIGDNWLTYMAVLKNWTSDDILTFQKVDCIYAFDVLLDDITNAAW